MELCSLKRRSIKFVVWSLKAHEATSKPTADQNGRLCDSTKLTRNFFIAFIYREISHNKILSSAKLKLFYNSHPARALRAVSSLLLLALAGHYKPLGLKSAQAVAILPGCLCFHENTNKKIAIKVLTLFSFSYLLIRPFNTSRC
jgi:hypothetical protein